VSAGGHSLAISAEGLGFVYPGRRRRPAREALVAVSFEVEQGEIFGFLGPNGGGKSTLFRILSTLLEAQTGRLQILGAELPREAPRLRRELGVVFQSPSLDPHLTVRENLLTQGRLYGLGRELAVRVDDQLQRFDLGERAGDLVRTLSGGLARRVEIAKALLHQPRLLLLDEPASGLDPRARRALWKQLERLREEGVTVLLTTHFIEEAAGCDRLALIDEGRLIVSGTPSELEEEVGGDVVTLTVGDPAALAGELEALLGLAPSVYGRTLRFEHRDAARLLGRLAEAFPGRIEAMSVARPTLEDVFIARTGHGLVAGDS
jgi:ABC-2 type transport system ATP-binding protein